MARAIAQLQTSRDGDSEAGRFQGPCVHPRSQNRHGIALKGPMSPRLVLRGADGKTEVLTALPAPSAQWAQTPIISVCRSLRQEQGLQGKPGLPGETLSQSQLRGAGSPGNANLGSIPSVEKKNPFFCTRMVKPLRSPSKAATCLHSQEQGATLSLISSFFSGAVVGP